MSGWSSLVASAEQQAALRGLAGSAMRGEASEIATRFARDRARAVLLTLAGWTAPNIAEAFGVGEDRCGAGGTGSPGAQLDQALQQAIANMNQERSHRHPGHNLPRAA